jgi:ssRNA-specific RNase YbeY (16S rRNA maturation enzyme)
MKETNLETRGVHSPTDILSFPFHFPKRPGLLEEPEFDVPDYYTLGDMMVCVPYVIRRCQEDQQYNEGGDFMETDEANEYDGNHSKDDSEDDEEEEEEEGLEEDDDRGVSGAMSTIYDPERRIRMLLVHGMLHLVGYDHEDDEEYLQMVQREEEILDELGDI